MPRSSVDPHAAEACRRKDSALMIASHDDPVVAQYLHTFAGSPQPSSRAFPCPGVSDEQIRDPVSLHDTGAMQLNPFFLRETVHDQQLIQRIFQRDHRMPRPFEGLGAHQESGRAKFPIDEKALVWLNSERWRAEVK